MLGNPLRNCEQIGAQGMTGNLPGCPLSDACSGSTLEAAERVRLVDLLDVGGLPCGSPSTCCRLRPGVQLPADEERPWPGRIRR